MPRAFSTLPLAAVLALLAPAFAGLAPTAGLGDGVAYRVHGTLATATHEGLVEYPGGECRVVHEDAGPRVEVTGRLPAPEVQASDGRFRVALPGPDCVPWVVEGRVLRDGAGEAPGVRVAWDPATGLLLSAERRGPRSVERVELVPTGAGSARALAYGMGFEGERDLHLAREGGFHPDVVASLHWGLHHTDMGWLAGVAGDVARAADRDVIVHWYYWADRATRPCIERGECDGRDLSVEDWHRQTRDLARELADALPEGRRAFVVVETEFNVYTNERDRAWWTGPFTDHMIETARILRAEGEGRVASAYSLGAWDLHEYAWFDRMTRAYDVPGFQTHGSMSPDGPDCHDGDDYEGLFERKSLAAARALSERTDKPLGLWDIFVSSHHPDDPAKGEAEQARYFRDLAAHADELERLGVAVVNVRALEDWVDAVPGCLGTGEEHLGLYDPRTERFKPAFHEYVRASEPDIVPAPGRADGPWTLPAGEEVKLAFRVRNAGDYTLAVRFTGPGEIRFLSTHHPAHEARDDGGGTVARGAPWPAGEGEVVTVAVGALQGEVEVAWVALEPRAAEAPDRSDGSDDGVALTVGP